MRTTTLAASIALTLLMPLYAQAQPANAGDGGSAPPAQPSAKMQKMYEERFKKADTNSDGKLSKSEAEAARMRSLARNFETVDTDKDGLVSPAELMVGMQKRPAQ